MRIHLDDAHSALLRYIYDRRKSPESAVALLIDRRMVTLSEVTALLGKLAALGLITMDEVGAMPVPSVTDAGQKWLYQSSEDLRGT